MAGSTRERLIDAGLRAFATKGVDGTAIVELEEAAGLAPGSGGFYRYFRTKDELLEAAVRREMDRVVARRPVDDPAPDADPRARITAALEQGFDTLAGLRPLIGVLARERQRLPGLAAEISERLVGDGVRADGRLVARARGAADVPIGADAAIGAVVMGAVVGYHLSTEYFGAAPGGVDRATFIAAIVDLVLPGAE